MRWHWSGRSTVCPRWTSNMRRWCAGGFGYLCAQAYVPSVPDRWMSTGITHNHARGAHGLGTLGTTDTVQRGLRWCGLTVTRDQAVSGLPHIPDLFADSYWIAPTYLQVSVAHPPAYEGASRLHAWGTSESAFVEARWGHRLAADYGEGAPQTPPTPCCPPW